MGRFSTQQVAPEDMPSAVRADRDRLRKAYTELAARIGLLAKEAETWGALGPERWLVASKITGLLHEPESQSKRD